MTIQLSVSNVVIIFRPQNYKMGVSLKWQKREPWGCMQVTTCCCNSNRYGQELLGENEMADPLECNSFARYEAWIGCKQNCLRSVWLGLFNPRVLIPGLNFIPYLRDM
jgi:hypothetical protein